MSGAAVALLLVLGVLVSLDGTSVGQVMISRPLVAAPAAGWIAGSFEAGLLAGVLLELLYLPVLPVGGGRFPEVGAGGVAAGAAAAVAGGTAGLAAGVLLGLGVGALGGGAIRALRALNGRLAPDPADPHLEPSRVRRAHLASVALDALRGMLVTALGLAGALVVAPRAAVHWPLSPQDTMGLLLAGTTFSLGLLLSNLAGTRWRRLALLGGGAVAGTLVATLAG